MFWSVCRSIGCCFLKETKRAKAPESLNLRRLLGEPDMLSTYAAQGGVGFIHILPRPPPLCRNPDFSGPLSLVFLSGLVPVRTLALWAHARLVLSVSRYPNMLATFASMLFDGYFFGRHKTHYITEGISPSSTIFLARSIYSIVIYRAWTTLRMQRQ